MATTPPQPCPDCDCSDSPLSIVANVLGILTFALGVTAYFAAFAAVTRGATKEMEDTRDALAMTQQQIAQTRELLKGFVAAKEDMDDVLREFDMGGKKPKARAARLSFSSRLRWWYYEKAVAAGMAKLREFQQHFAAVQLIFLESKIKRQSDDISDLLHRAEHPC